MGNKGSHEEVDTKSEVQPGELLMTWPLKLIKSNDFSATVVMPRLPNGMDEGCIFQVMLSRGGSTTSKGMMDLYAKEKKKLMKFTKEQVVELEETLDLTMLLNPDGSVYDPDAAATDDAQASAPAPSPVLQAVVTGLTSGHKYAMQVRCVDPTFGDCLVKSELVLFTTKHHVSADELGSADMIIEFTKLYPHHMTGTTILDHLPSRKREREAKREAHDQTLKGGGFAEKHRLEQLETAGQ